MINKTIILRNDSAVALCEYLLETQHLHLPALTLLIKDGQIPVTSQKYLDKLLKFLEQSCIDLLMPYDFDGIDEFIVVVDTFCIVRGSDCVS